MKFSGKKIYLVSAFLLFLSFFFAANFCFAAFLKPEIQANIGNQAIKAGESGFEVSGTDIYGLVQTVINAFLAVIGTLLLIYMLYAGYNWMSAQGDEEKVTKAKDTIQRAIIGLIIIIAAYAISVFVMARLEAGTLRSGAYNGPSASSRPACCDDGTCAGDAVCT